MDLKRNKKARHSDALSQFKLDMKSRASSASRTRFIVKEVTEPKIERLNSSGHLLKSAKSAKSTKSTSLLRKIRNRISSKAEDFMNVSPQLAANVVKKYLLPMFENEKKEWANKVRLDTMRLPKSKSIRELRSEKELQSEYISLDNWDTSRTVYGDYKLSEKLVKEMESVKLELSNTSKRLKEAEQAKEITESEMRNLSEKLMKSVRDRELLLFQQTADMKSSQRMQLNTSLLYMQLGKLKELYKEARLENAKFKQQLHGERSENDIRFYKFRK